MSGCSVYVDEISTLPSQTDLLVPNTTMTRYLGRVPMRCTMSDRSKDVLSRFAIRWLLHSLMWGLGGSMDAKGRAELGEVLIHHSGLAPPADGADLTSLQVRRSLPNFISLLGL